MKFLKDYFNNIKEKTKDMPTKQKINYFWIYYKYHFLIAFIIVIFIVSIINTEKKETILYGAFINSINNPTDNSNNEKEIHDLKTKYMLEYNINSDDYEIFIDNSLYLYNDYSSMETIMNNQQKFTVLVYASELDIVATDITAFESIAYNNLLIDIRECLSDLEIEQYKDDFYYIDKDILDYTNNENYLESNQVIKYPENINEMTNPIPVGIYIGENSQLLKNYEFTDIGLIGIIKNSKRKENAVDFINIALR